MSYILKENHFAIKNLKEKKDFLLKPAKENFDILMTF